MKDLVERVLTAIDDAFYGQDPEGVARAAIETVLDALKEPSVASYKAGCVAFNLDVHYGNVDKTWQAMLEQARKEALTAQDTEGMG